MENKQVEFGTTPTSREGFHDEDVTLLNYVRVVLKYRRMILWVCVVVVAATVTINLLLPKTYAATTSIVPPVDILEKEYELAGGGFGLGKSSMLRKAIGVTSIADMYVGILESRAVADALIESFDLMNVYKGDGLKSTVRKELKKNTSIKVSDEGIVRITVKDRDPNRVAAMANAYVGELDRQNKRLSEGQATSKRIFLANRLKEVEEKLSKIENILSREATTQEMLFELLTREYEIAKIEEARSMPTIQILDQAVVPEKRMPRSTGKKAVLAGISALMFTVFLAFAREYVLNTRKAEARRQQRSALKPAEQEDDDNTLGELESHRKIVSSQRRKRPQENRLYSQQA